MQEKVSDIFETADLGTAAFLVTMGCRLLSAGTDRGRYSFIFEGESKCRDLAVQYISSEYRYLVQINNITITIRESQYCLLGHVNNVDLP